MSEVNTIWGRKERERERARARERVLNRFKDVGILISGVKMHAERIFR